MIVHSIQRETLLRKIVIALTGIVVGTVLGYGVGTYQLDQRHSTSVSSEIETEASSFCQTGGLVQSSVDPDCLAIQMLLQLQAR